MVLVSLKYGVSIGRMLYHGCLFAMGISIQVVVTLNFRCEEGDLKTCRK